MILKDVVELTWRFYQNGKPQASNQQLLKADMEQKMKLLFADAMRQRYYESMKMDKFGEPDYSFVSPILEVKKFELTEADRVGMRRADMTGATVYRLPKNSHFTNVYPVADGCGNEDMGEITQVAPSEENFYINDSDLSSEMFFVVKGKGINTYNVPPCVKAVNVEASYDLNGDTEIDNSIASIIIDQILNVALGIKKQFYSEQVQKEMQEQNIIK